MRELTDSQKMNIIIEDDRESIVTDLEFKSEISPNKDT